MKKGKGRVKKIIKIFVTSIMLLMFIFMLCGVGAYAKYKPQLMELVNNADKKIELINEVTFKDKTETVLYDSNKKVIKKIAPHEYYYINYKDINPNIVNATISIEDKRYLTHKGIDYKAILRASIELVKNKGKKTQGGSTITQQLVKVSFLTLDKVWSRKIEEMIIAVKLEQLYTKSQILEFYTNNINYGNGAYGIETASRAYFNKPSKNLTLSEVAFLVGIPNNPSVYNPVKNMNNTLKRRNIILSVMKEEGYVTDDEYIKAKAQKIVLNMPKKEYEPDNYVVSYALSNATKKLMETQGFQFKYSFSSKEDSDKYYDGYNDLFKEIYSQIRNGGYNIYTSIDMKKQNELQKSLNNGLDTFKEKDSKTGLYKTQGAGVVINNETGLVEAIVGGRTQAGKDNTFNRAFLAYRQPGSIIKPILVYTPAFERGLLASTIVEDKKIEKGPKNSGKGYAGKVELRYAVEKSFNTVPYQLTLDYKPLVLLEYLKNMKFSNIVDADNNASISIGGFTYGASPIEMASAYSTLARNGEYIEPSSIIKITDISDTTLYQNKSNKVKIYNSDASYLMTDILKGVVSKKHGTGYNLGVPNMPTAGKTGTTDDSKDAWFAGYTPYYTTVIWVGNDTPQSIYKLYGGTYPGHIWNDFMTKIHKSLKFKDFEIPSTIHEMYMNPNTGEVDNDDHGWWGKDLITDTYLSIHGDKIALEKKIREKKEYDSKYDYRIYGLTDEEESRREALADETLIRLTTIHINSRDNYSQVDLIIKEAKSILEDVKHKESKDAFYIRLNKKIDELKVEKDRVEKAEEDKVPEKDETTNDNPVEKPIEQPIDTSPPTVTE